MDKQEGQSFGAVIWQARRKKRLSQRELAVKVGVDYTYLSKLENDHLEPSEKVIRSLAKHLELNAEELIYLGGRMTEHDTEALEEMVRANYKEMPALFRRVRENPGIDSFVEAREDQLAKLQKENATLQSKISELEKQLRIYRFFSKAEIERSANEILQRMQAKNFILKSPFDVTRVADFLEVSICYAIIPPDEEGPIVAKILRQERTIILNKDICEFHNKLSSSTIAHEIGHWVLHQVNQDEVETLSEQHKNNSNFEKKGDIFLCRLASEQLDRYSLNKQENWVEWQAQYFATCLLMPRYILEEKRMGRNLTNWSHFYAMADELGVTLSNLTNRLQDLGWVYIPKGSRQIYPGKG
ncbi:MULTISPECIES: helix-turn-helix domain-containing protein [unclassified Microcoleus]|uniref:helix-turn-helix domain-containing protein n=1 Tax=unclassified Microcoleus TaxID=2642155 RepID=UPI002FD0B686